MDSGASSSASAARATRNVRFMRMFRSARGLRFGRLVKVLRVVRFSKVLTKAYLALTYELDAKARKQDEGEPLVGFVEVAWRGKVERTCFPLPFEVKYLSQDSKQKFLSEVRERGHPWKEN